MPLLHHQIDRSNRWFPLTLTLKQVPELAEHTMAKARQIVRLMGLLHDLGHPAFAHAGEAGIPGKHHEDVSVYGIQNILGELLDSTFFRELRHYSCG